jgi:hypothetical protein
MRRIHPGGLVFILLALPLGCGRGGKAPTLLQATPEAVVLIRDNEARCAKIGQDGTQRLAAAEMEAERDIRALGSYRLRPLREYDSPLDVPSPPVQPSEVFKKYLAEDAVEELAASDAAQALIQGLLPEVKAEASPELADAVAALSAAHDQVCRSIRQPRRSSQYQTTIDFAENGYRSAEEKLRPLYLVSATDSRFALHKYSPPLEAARAATHDKGTQPVRSAKDYERARKEWQVAQQLQSQQEADHEVAVKKFYGKRDGSRDSVPRLGVATSRHELSPEELAQAMNAWYPQYTASATRVKTALANFAQLRNAGVTDASLYDSCERVMAGVVPLLNDPMALEAPDPQVAKPLRAAFSELEAMAQACRDHQSSETIIRLNYFDHTLAQAATALRAYSLVP